LAADHDRPRSFPDRPQYLGDVRNGNVQHATVVIAEGGTPVNQAVESLGFLAGLNIQFHEGGMHMLPRRWQVFPTFLLKLAAGAQIEPCQLIWTLCEFSAGGMAERRSAIQPVVGRDMRAEKRKWSPVRRGKSGHVIHHA
jgi:hypothetical protein